MFADDLGYSEGPLLDTGNPLSLIDDTATGKQATGRSYETLLAYDYGLFYLAWLGMLEDTDQFIIRWGRDEYRNWNVRNMPWSVQPGDHESRDEIGYQFAAPATYAQWAPGMAAWDDLFRRCCPRLTSAQPLLASGAISAWCWAICASSARIVCHSRPGTPVSTYEIPANISAIYSADQIEDLLNAADNSEPFKVLVIAYGGLDWWRDQDTGVWKPQYWLGKYPLKLLQPTEYARLFTGAGHTPPSFMDNPATNGATGCLLVAMGDGHVPYAWRSYGYAQPDTRQ